MCDKELPLTSIANSPKSFISLGKQPVASTKGVWIASAFNFFEILAGSLCTCRGMTTTSKSPSDDAGCFGTAGEVRGGENAGMQVCALIAETTSPSFPTCARV